jgi:integrase
VPLREEHARELAARIGRARAAGLEHPWFVDNLKLSQRLLGHANIQSTMRYAHALEGDLRAALEDETDASSRNSPEAKSGTDE